MFTGMKRITASDLSFERRSKKARCAAVGEPLYSAAPSFTILSRACGGNSANNAIEILSDDEGDTRHNGTVEGSYSYAASENIRAIDMHGTQDHRQHLSYATSSVPGQTSRVKHDTALQQLHSDQLCLETKQHTSTHFPAQPPPYLSPFVDTSAFEVLHVSPPRTDAYIPTSAKEQMPPFTSLSVDEAARDCVGKLVEDTVIGIKNGSKTPLRLGHSMLSRKSESNHPHPPTAQYHVLSSTTDEPPACVIDDKSREEEPGLFVEQSEATQLQAPDARRQERIRQKMLRNERYREDANTAESTSNDHDNNNNWDLQQNVDLITRRHVAGDILAGQLSTNPATMLPSVPPIRSKTRKLGRIETIDLKLILWFDLRLDWTEIETGYRQLTGEARNRRTLRERARKVQQAMRIADVDASLQRMALDGDATALADINLMLSERVGGKLDTLQKPKPSTGCSLPSAADNNRQPNSPEGDRSVVSGKQPSWELLRTYWVAHPSDCSEAESEACSESEASPDALEDYVHYAYQVQRRECSAIEVDNGVVSIDEVPWHDVDEPHTTLSRANAAASGKVLLLQIGVEPIVNGLDGCTISKSVDDRGLVSCQYASEAGTVQTRVERKLRTFVDHIKVVDRSEWCPRTIYAVKQRIERRAVADDVNGDAASLGVEEVVVKGELCADLRWTNEQAIDHFVNTTLTVRTVNLNTRDLAIAQAKRLQRERLDAAGDETMFEAEKETSMGLVKVWVEKLKLVGPRNL